MSSVELFLQTPHINISQRTHIPNKKSIQMQTSLTPSVKINIPLITQQLHKHPIKFNHKKIVYLKNKNLNFTKSNDRIAVKYFGEINNKFGIGSMSIELSSTDHLDLEKNAKKKIINSFKQKSYEKIRKLIYTPIIEGERSRIQCHTEKNVDINTLISEKEITFTDCDENRLAKLKKRKSSYNTYLSKNRIPSQRSPTNNGMENLQNNILRTSLKMSGIPQKQILKTKVPIFFRNLYNKKDIKSSSEIMFPMRYEKKAIQSEDAFASIYRDNRIKPRYHQPTPFLIDNKFKNIFIPNLTQRIQNSLPRYGRNLDEQKTKMFYETTFKVSHESGRDLFK
jgi:hypothetical protein